MADPQKPRRRSGIAHIIAAIGYALDGLRRLMQESAFRQELAFLLALLALLVVLDASAVEMVGLVALGLLLIGVEALNTAIEVLVDHLSPDWSPWAKQAKDLASFAVACVIGVILLYAGIVLYP